MRAPKDLHLDNLIYAGFNHLIILGIQNSTQTPFFSSQDRTQIPKDSERERERGAHSPTPSEGFPFPLAGL